MTRSTRPIGRIAVLSAALALVPATGVAAAGAATGSTATRSAPGLTVVASTSWVGALAKLAGAGKVTIITPANLQHPPDYEPKASDLLAVRNADFVLLAGYEGFATKLRDAAGGHAKVVIVSTTYLPAALAASITKLGAALGTPKAAATGAASVKAAIAAVCSDLRMKVMGTKPTVVSHVVVTDWVACAGLKPSGVFGPAPITPSEVKKLAALKPTVVFESHNMAGSGAAVSGSTGAKEIELENFPGATLDLVAVAKKNAALIAGVLAG